MGVCMGVHLPYGCIVLFIIEKCCLPTLVQNVLETVPRSIWRPLDRTRQALDLKVVQAQLFPFNQFWDMTLLHTPLRSRSISRGREKGACGNGLGPQELIVYSLPKQPQKKKKKKKLYRTEDGLQSVK